MRDLLISLVDDIKPEDNDVVAGPLGFALWIFMILAVVVIGFSMVKHLRKAEAARDAGLFGDEPVARDEPVTRDESTTRTDRDD